MNTTNTNTAPKAHTMTDNRTSRISSARPASVEEAINRTLSGYFRAIEEDENFDLIPYTDEEGEFLLYTEEAERRARLDVAHFLRLADLICDLAYSQTPTPKHPTSHDNPLSWWHHLSYEEMGYEFYFARQGRPAFRDFIKDGHPKTPDDAIWVSIYETAFTFPRIKPENVGRKGDMVGLFEVSLDRDASGHVNVTYL